VRPHGLQVQLLCEYFGYSHRTTCYSLAVEDILEAQAALEKDQMGPSPWSKRHFRSHEGVAHYL